MTKSAFISICGRPNVGKSTLLNALIGEKIAIVSKKPQTTRTRITGVVTRGESQYVFIDTPGIHRPRTKLGEYMMKSVSSSIGDTDITLFVVEAGRELTEGERDALKRAFSDNGNVILVINKCDAVNKTLVAETIRDLSAQYDFTAVVPISALTGDGVSLIFDELEPLLVDSPHFFPDDQLTDMPEKQLVAEMIREKVLRLTDDEIPHGVAVVIEEFKERRGAIAIRAELFCERETHKRILIGKNGSMLKKIGTYAREDAEAFFGAKVYLDLWVKVKENWRDRQSLLNSFGYGEDR